NTGCTRSPNTFQLLTTPTMRCCGSTTRKLAAEAEPAPDLGPLPVHVPPLVAVAEPRGVDVLDVLRDGRAHPLLRHDAPPVPHATVQVQPADAGEVVGLEKEPALRVRVPGRRLLPMEIPDPQRAEQVAPRVLVHVHAGRPADDLRHE